MSDIIKPEGPGGILPHLKDGGLDLPKPFERDIYLFNTYVAGTSYINNIKAIELNLKIDEKLFFYREPDNEFDPQAIRIETSYGQKIGFVPRRDNIIFSRLMDAGKELFGKIESKEYQGEWLRIDIKIYLHEI